MNRSTTIALFFSSAFLALLVAIKSGWIAREWITGTSGVSSICMSSYVGLLVYTALLFLGLRMVFYGISNRSIRRGLLGLALALGGIFHGAHLVVRRDDAIRVQILVWPYQIAPYDAHTSALNMGGYEKAHHFDPHYPCYEYCESFFLRRYQVGSGKECVVYRGLLPFLGLTEDHWWPPS